MVGQFLSYRSAGSFRHRVTHKELVLSTEGMIRRLATSPMPFRDLFMQRSES